MEAKKHSHPLKDLREQARLTQLECARALGIKVQTYCMKEQGQRGVTPDELALLADLYNLPLSEAFPGYEPTSGDRALARHLAAA
jgi:transcriptional regulator with XRE-family HTH domain